MRKILVPQWSSNSPSHGSREQLPGSIGQEGEGERFLSVALGTEFRCRTCRSVRCRAGRHLQKMQHWDALGRVLEASVLLKYMATGCACPYMYCVGPKGEGRGCCLICRVDGGAREACAWYWAQLAGQLVQLCGSISSSLV